MAQRTEGTKGEKLIAAIEDRRIIKDYRTNHGQVFFDGLERLHKARFHDYLGSCGRYLLHCRLTVRNYYG